MTIMGLDALVEARIERAIERGELSGLPGQGSPLRLDEDACVAPELRLAYRILKNAGYVPEEIELRREIMSLAVLIDATEGPERTRATARRDWLRARLALRSGAGASLLEHREYAERVAERLDRSHGHPDRGAAPSPAAAADRGAVPSPDCVGGLKSYPDPRLRRIRACRRWSDTSGPGTG